MNRKIKKVARYEHPSEIIIKYGKKYGDDHVLKKILSITSDTHENHFLVFALFSYIPLKTYKLLSIECKSRFYMFAIAILNKNCGIRSIKYLYTCLMNYDISLHKKWNNIPIFSRPKCCQGACGGGEIWCLFWECMQRRGPKIAMLIYKLFDIRKTMQLSVEKSDNLVEIPSLKIKNTMHDVNEFNIGTIVDFDACTTKKYELAELMSRKVAGKNLFKLASYFSY